MGEDEFLQEPLPRGWRRGILNRTTDLNSTIETGSKIYLKLIKSSGPRCQIKLAEELKYIKAPATGTKIIITWVSDGRLEIIQCLPLMLSLVYNELAMKPGILKAELQCDYGRLPLAAI